MTRYVSEAVPFRIMGNLKVLTDQQVAEQPWLMDFIARWPKYFEHDGEKCIWIFHPEGDAPC